MCHTDIHVQASHPYTENKNKRKLLTRACHDTRSESPLLNSFSLDTSSEGVFSDQTINLAYGDSFMDLNYYFHSLLIFEITLGIGLSFLCVWALGE